MTKQYEHHPVASIFPLMKGADLKALADDIEEQQLQDPIALYEGKVLDGRNRLACCTERNVEPRFIKVNPDDPIAYVKSKNLHRRQLTQSQLSMVAARSMEQYEKRALERKSEGGKKSGPGRPTEKDVISGAGLSRDAAGAEYGVSGPSVQRAKRVVNYGVPELETAVDDGVVSISVANDLTYLDAPDQEAAVQAHVTNDKPAKQKWFQRAKKKKPVAKQARGRKKKASLPNRISSIVKGIETLVREIEKSTKGVSAQRERAIDRLKLARKYVNESVAFI